MENQRLSTLFSPIQKPSTMNSSSTHATHAWVRLDLVQTLVQENGRLPKHWTVRERTRGHDGWGWCRAIVVSTSAASSPQLRKLTNQTAVDQRWRGSPERLAKTVTCVLKIIPDEWVPRQLWNNSVNVTYQTADDQFLVGMANAWWSRSDGAPPEDLCVLEQLHEPAVVYCLWHRYQQDKIYTYTGNILIALNPFRNLPQLYNEETLQLYCRDHQHDPNYRPQPHIYAIAQDAYRSLLRSLQTNTPTNQSILVSGESGAGKTVTTKIILSYLAQRSQQVKQHSKQNTHHQVLQSNPILESFGNARTIRNDNSSRFGKFMEIRFNNQGALVSASIETYLLEKVRLVAISQGERNYHVFYQVLAALPKTQAKALRVYQTQSKDYYMTAQSGTFTRRDGVSDSETFAQLVDALEALGFGLEDQLDLFRIVCGLLHTSNLDFTERGDQCILNPKNPSLPAVLELLGVQQDALNAALVSCAIQVAGETLYKNLSMIQAHKAKEALIKVTYSAMFGYIGQHINNYISRDNVSGASIGVLDIFGFESLETNSLEQLCINYCNEALQQQFNRFVFTLEQEEYEREGIDWSFIEFPDNQDVLDLIEKRHEGILSILDEQSRLQRCTDKSFALTVYEKCSSHPRLVATKQQRASLCFGIEHYAGMVEYDTANFLEKNKDELPKEATELLLSSSVGFVSKLGRWLMETTTASCLQSPLKPQSYSNNRKQLTRATSSILRDSVGIQFSHQLRELRTRIEATQPFYVRCLKPNDDLTANNFEPLVIADQLRCSGVLEAIRVSRVGFPHRYYHDHFVQRYSMLRPSRKMPRVIGMSQCELLVQTLAPQITKVLNEKLEDGRLSGTPSRNGTNVQYNGMQMGLTKVFLRRRAFEALEHLRSRKITDAVVKIQSFYRMITAQVQYEIAIYAAILIQNFFRRIEAYRRYRIHRHFNAARTIQNSFRCYRARNILFSAYVLAWYCQSIWRGAQARQYCAYLFLDKNASVIQRTWQRYRRRFFFRRVRRSVICIQALYRSYIAKKALYRLRRDARDLTKVAAERDKLREESRQLRRELERTRVAERKEKSEEMGKLRDEINRLRIDLEKAHRMQTPSKDYDKELKFLIQECERKEQQLEVLKSELASLRSLNDSFSIRSDGSPFINIPRGSPVRSDVSLLDTDYEDPNPEQLLGAAFQRSVVPLAATIESPRHRDFVLKEDVKILHAAIRQVNRKMFDEVLATTKDRTFIVNEGDKYGRTALHLASLARNLDMVNILLAYGAAVNIQDDDGETPLHLTDDASMMELLLNKGNANPDIPNIDGICALHLAVQRRDIDTVRALIRSNANVNNADNIRWFTPLHLIALPGRKSVQNKNGGKLQQGIAQLLCGSIITTNPDLNFQDSEGNSPLHYAAQLTTADACELISIFLTKGANPNVCNQRGQSPLHLLCHNEELRPLDTFQEAVHAMLFHGANPNLRSITGCTPLHLSLYHKDVDSAIQLVNSGAELHIIWQKPKRWSAFWDDKGSSEILALDMVQDSSTLYRILAAISTPHAWAPARSWCMHCQSALGTFSRAMHCRHCSRLICGSCAIACLPPEYFPKSFDIHEASWVCVLCEKILIARRDENSNSTHPTSSYGDDDEKFEC